MTETFSVQELRYHEAALRGVDSATQAQAQQAQALGIGDWKMYGLFVSPVACGILAVGNAAHGRTIRELAGVTQAVAEGFATTADLYQSAEESNVDLGRAIADQINSMQDRSAR